jgi:hypothetical protein
MNDVDSPRVCTEYTLKIMFAMGWPGSNVPGIISASKLSETYK